MIIPDNAMTVRDLIEALKTWPSHYYVMTDDPENDTQVSFVNFTEPARVVETTEGYVWRNWL